LLRVREKENALAFIEEELVMLQKFWNTIYLFRPKLPVSKSMKMALKDTKLSDVDAIVMHAPEP
jgi:diketogulonate reductase-like aldo/keto reductase